MPRGYEGSPRSGHPLRGEPSRTASIRCNGREYPYGEPAVQPADVRRDRGEQTRETTTCHQWWLSQSAPYRRVWFRNQRRDVADRGTFDCAARNTNADTDTNA